jgi:uncharacterized protein YkwD
MSLASTVSSYGSDFRSFEFPTFRKFFISAHDHFIPHPRNNYHPHILSHRMLALLSILLLTVKIAAISLVAISPAMTAEASAITSQTVISLANAARAEGGLEKLTPNSKLAAAAQSKANDMLARQYFSHNTPTGETPWTFIKAVGYSYVTAGENLAIDFSEAESVQSAWMNSPGHRANIMNKAFQEIGIGISSGEFNGHRTTIVVQMFGTPIGQQVSLPSTPTPVAQPAPATAPAAPVSKSTPAPAPAPSQAQAPRTTVQAQPNTIVPAPTAQAAVPAQPAAPITPADPVPGLPVGTQPLGITATDTALQGNQLYLTASASSDATKLLAVYGMKSIMLDPAGNNQWYGYIPLADLDVNTNLLIYAYDINGNLTHAQVGQLSPTLNASLNPAVEGASISLLGNTINPNAMQQKIFLVILAALLSCLVLAIAVRRHVQHVGLIANTAFVAMLAAFMIMT